MADTYIKSPINYSGSKYRLLKQLIPLFPENINTFVDLFSGACNVGVNVKAEKVICNDLIHYLPELFNTWKLKSLDEINTYIDNAIKENGLSSTNKSAFELFRNKYNETKNVEDLFILICYSFNYQIRFNNSHQYNSSFGKEASTMNNNIRNNVNKFVEVIQGRDICFKSGDFRQFDYNLLTPNDFVYADPPYLVSGAVYQDGKRGFSGWKQQDDDDLCRILDELNANGIRFAMSNMLESKGIRNEKLIDWASKYNVIELSINYGGSNYQRKKEGKDIEVVIKNY